MLGELPLEILRRVCSELSPEAALNFSHSCRNTYQVSDDWIVWRTIVRGSARIRTEESAAESEERGKNQGTMGDADIVRAPPEIQRRLAVERFLPQLLVLGYTMTASLDLQAVYAQCQALVSSQEYPASLVREKTDSSRWFEFLTDPKSRFDSKEWLAAQTASFCFAVGVLSDFEYSYQSEEPFARLEDVQWFNSTANQEGCSDSLVMQHVLANAAVGSFCLELRAALSGEMTIGEDFEGTSIPPTASSIPLTSPIQLSPESLQTASPSCLVASVAPSFFTETSWTGYISTRGDWRSVYHGIGGHNLKDLSSSKALDHMSNGPTSVDHAVRFQVADILASGDFVLRSNFFHTRNDMYTLIMLVESRTGRLSVCMSRLGDSTPKLLQKNVRNALNTPFGIVHGIEPGSWLWLWKSSWSAGNETVK
ncbi:hypothetical protein EKO04_010881 [Ascochyta lentis]|uniref:F-box domain-containing protein n=1 Tax=Ascochyta lentis TaxID=205686 RepID=A0A8H7IXN7_9PLEO|nr:hypothetical protein EKO04_010881 [Ascochyta lentis]